MHIVWFKRDLRLHDHAPLSQAVVSGGPVLPLYILEPALWRQPDMSGRHYAFLQDCLGDLNQQLCQLGQPLIVRAGEVVDVLDRLAAQYPGFTLWSHAETWNGWTYERDKAVLNWSKRKHIPWHEIQKDGVIRCLQNRDGWAKRWYETMRQPVVLPPLKLSAIDIQSDILPEAKALGLQDDPCPDRQKGGRAEALSLMDSFLHKRGEFYTKQMSSPVTAYDACSRLSAHLAFGSISVREVFHWAEWRKAEISALPRGTKGGWPSALRSFLGRLRWHCHFIQKLEDQPCQEFENLHSAYNGLREDAFNETYYIAWKTGRTGYPMVDACMRALAHTGWLNFRMRAMVMSFASYYLWLHWRRPALHLAQMFTDYEPGIHYSQCQMQSGTTGINTLRIYNPIKQGMDHDPEGVFIRRWLPELAGMPDEHIHTPWKAPLQMSGYPMPIVDEKGARTQAVERLYSVRRSSDHKALSQKIVQKHGSRRRPNRRSTRTSKSPSQFELPLSAKED